MSEIKLLPCPFCGGYARLKKYSFFTHSAYIKCEKCGARTLEFSSATLEDAILKAVKAWNERTPVEDLLMQLKEELEFSEKEKERCAGGNPLQFENSKGYKTGICYAIEAIKIGMME